LLFSRTIDKIYLLTITYASKDNDWEEYK